MECARRLWFLIGELFHHEKIFSFGDFYSSGCLVLITNSKLVISNHRLLGNPLIPIQALNINFLLEPKSRKAKIGYKRKCDVGASKNAGQAFSTSRLSSHFLLYQISGFRFFSPSNKLVFNPPFSPTVDLDSQKKELIPYPRCGFGACLRCE